jgi:putative transposase
MAITSAFFPRRPNACADARAWCCSVACRGTIGRSRPTTRSSRAPARELFSTARGPARGALGLRPPRPMHPWGYSQRRACGLVGLHPKTYRYASKRSGDEELRIQLRELTSQRRRVRLSPARVDVEAPGHQAQSQEALPALQGGALSVRRRGGRKRALGTRAPMAIPRGLAAIAARAIK